MKITILAFGIARDILGGKQMSVVLNKQANVADLKARLIADFPDFSKLASLAIAVNQEYVGDDYVLKEMDEVVIIPPVSGG